MQSPYSVVETASWDKSCQKSMRVGDFPKENKHTHTKQSLKA